ncbi:hypothetical protein MKZ38_001021 [Zalerion maritima]|uniref:DUF6594 domain-containing protein n=1 Tax=Zalerion maritima TaxID=339359 RepID=A0AAD5WTD7_9PEZI|nr:hypothetical protein MKZ38_001021 [Zalerion maritima]
MYESDEKNLFDYVTRSLDEEENFHFLQFEFLQRLNLTQFEVRLARLKSRIQKNKKGDNSDVETLEKTLRGYAQAVRDYKLFKSQQLMTTVELSHRKLLLQRYFQHSSDYNDPYQSHYAYYKTASSPVDPLRKAFMRRLPSQLTYSHEERRQRAREFEEGKPPLMVSKFVDGLVRFVLAVTGGLFLVVPMMIMAIKPSETKSLIMVSVSLLVFSLVLAMGIKVSNVETLVATATYAAVLVVFVGTSTDGTGLAALIPDIHPPLPDTNVFTETLPEAMLHIGKSFCANNLLPFSLLYQRQRMVHIFRSGKSKSEKNRQAHTEGDFRHLTRSQGLGDPEATTRNTHQERESIWSLFHPQRLFSQRSTPLAPRREHRISQSPSLGELTSGITASLSNIGEGRASHERAQSTHSGRSWSSLHSAKGSKLSRIWGLLGQKLHHGRKSSDSMRRVKSHLSGRSSGAMSYSSQASKDDPIQQALEAMKLNLDNAFKDTKWIRLEIPTEDFDYLLETGDYPQAFRVATLDLSGHLGLLGTTASRTEIHTVPPGLKPTPSGRNTNKGPGDWQRPKMIWTDGNKSFAKTSIDELHGGMEFRTPGREFERIEVIMTHRAQPGLRTGCQLWLPGPRESGLILKLES